MSFTVNGFTFQQQSAFDHAISQLNFMNSLLDSQSLPTLTPSNDNALWWTLLGQGSFAAFMDQVVVQATNSLNVAACDDNQIINLLPIAGTELIPQSQSVVFLTASASTGTLTIPSGTLVPYGPYYFSTQSTLIVAASGTGNVNAYCTTFGPITVPPYGINLTTLDGISNLSSIKNYYEAIPGRDIETPSQARTRILAGKTIGVGIDGAISALNMLPGIGQAQVYWNPATSGYLAVSGLSAGLPPRTAWILVQNPVDQIAETYLSYMNLPTSGTSFTPSYTQNYTTLAGQSFPVNYDISTFQQIYAKVYIDTKNVIQNGYQDILNNTIIALNSTFGIGQRVSSEQLSVALADFSLATILGVTVALTSGGTYGQYVDINARSVPYFVASGISVVLA